MSEEITLLIKLQEKDRRCADLLVQVEHLKVQKAQVERKIEQERFSVAELRQQLKQLEHDSRLKNLEVDDLDMQIREYRKRLNEGIISFKEMEALRAKIANQRKRISDMEDKALALMDEIESTKTRLTEAQERLVGREKELTATCEELASRMVQLQEEIATEEKERVQVAAKIRTHLLARYENLRAKFDESVVAITDGSCSGCKLKVSGNTIERARSGVEIVTCENCSRILYIH